MNENRDMLILKQITETFDELGIAYTIGGSIASSFYGVVRFTQDADIMVKPFPEIADKFYEITKSDFYISKDAMHQALKSHTSFNLIHLDTAFKIDIFVLPLTDFQSLLFDRSSQLKLSDSIEKLFCCVSPEDIILLKLRWYLETNCSSERQWSDVLGVLEVQKNSLDIQYLRTWAKKFALTDLLEQAISNSKT